VEDETREEETTMKRTFAMTLLLPLVSVVAGCAADRVPPKALVDAREDFVRTRDGAAIRLDPTDVHEADLALQRAEQAWRANPDAPSTVDLAIVADRKALLAQSEARVIEARNEAAQLHAQLEATKTAQLSSTKQQLGRTEQALGATQMQLQQEEVAAAAQRQKLQELEASLKDARETIAKIASIKDDDRGMVITLPGEVLFKTGKHDLKPGAMAKLDGIADALKGKETHIVVIGHTDDVGTADHNQALSLIRAQTVRDYIVSKGIPNDLATAEGKGPSQPVADNTSVEGRAQNRRVEIIVQPRK
jgi:outer membrane protein OmpA-like peptidoglycan-associated protein